MKKKTILFIHQNFPAQFKFLAPHLSLNKDYEIYSLSLKKNRENKELDENLSSMKNITHYQYEITRGSTEDIHVLAAEFEAKMIRAEAVAKKCLELKETGLQPDLIINHPGWGEIYLLKDVWPDVKFLSYFEFYYNTKGSDIDFDLGEKNHPKPGFDLFAKIRARNAPGMMSYLESDKLICPTEFQKSTAPDEFRNKIKVIHDGIDTSIIKPVEGISVEVEIKNQIKLSLTKKDKIVTFINRNLEPYRGYHSFMRSIPGIQKKHPDALFLIIGGDKISYGAKSISGESYKNIYFNEVKDDLIDPNKLLFLGKVEYDNLLKILSISSAHIYLTYPFVLSWSMLEAMALENIIIGSKTEPVEEIITDNKNGLLVDFFDTNQISKTVNDVLANPDKYQSIRKNARKTIISKYDLNKVCLPEQIKLVEGLLNG